MSVDPFKDSAPSYLALGWTPLWLPYGKKFPPPKGYTGYSARPVTAGRVRMWSLVPGNIGVHLPRDVIAIDIDAYHDGLTTLAALEAVYGALPPTWSATNRDDGSRHLLYRCNTDLPGGLGAGIDIVQGFHRYLVVAPSLHPEGRVYRWWDPDGAPCELPSRPEALVALPDGWLAVQAPGRPAGRVRQRRLHRSAQPVMDTDVDDFIAEHDANHWPESWDWVAEHLAREGSRHDRLVAAAVMVARDARRGRYPAQVGFERLRAWWHDVMDDLERRDGDEFFAALAWAVAQAEDEDDEADTTWDGAAIPRPPRPDGGSTRFRLPPNPWRSDD